MKINQILIMIFISLFVGLSVYIYKPKAAEIKLDFPNLTNVDPSLDLSCEALVGANMYSSKISDKGIHASIFRGTDLISVELDSKNNFKLISQASLRVGQISSSENWKVLQNNKSFLIAELSKFSDVPIDNYVDLFYLNKENGMAVLTKTRATYLDSITPESQSYMFKCN